MKKIFLIGDSIRYGVGGEDGHLCGYGHYVKQKLEGVIEIYAPDDNSRFLQYTLRYLNEWAQALGAGEDIDVVHWNNGLWDVLRLFGDGPLTPVEMYRDLLVRVHGRIRLLFPRAKVIFALTTPVIEEMASPDFIRKNSEIDRYNQVAVETLTPLGVTINDLNRYASEIQRQYFLDWVHFNPEGNALLADRVVDAIRSVLEAE